MPSLPTAVDDYFGTSVSDPYRALEDPDSPETAAFLERQEARAAAFFAGHPARERIAERHRALLDFERIGVPVRSGATFLVAKNAGLQNQAVLYVSRGPGLPERVLLDPNLLSDDGTVALAAAELSPDGTLLAYGLQRAGSDWTSFRVRDVASGNDLDDLLEWSKFSSAAWAANTSGFYYNRYEAPKEGDELIAVNESPRVFFHRIGTPQTEDTLVWSSDDPDLHGHAHATEDGRFLFIYDNKGFLTNGLSYRDLDEPEAPLVRLFENGHASYAVVDTVGSTIYARTTAGAPRGRLVRFDIANPAELVDVIPEGPDTLEGVGAAGGRFFALSLHDAHARVAVYDRAGAACGDIPLPGIGSVAGFDGRERDTEVYFAFSAYTTPATIYRYDIGSGAVERYAEPRVAFAADDYLTEQTFATSRDGTRVPIFVTHARTAPRDGTRPAILYGYGGFNVSLTPAFSTEIALWLSLGGTYAVANLRGGGEYGDAWHLAGMGDKKQNVFDDFIACAEHLVAQGFTSHDRLAIAGASNGGLLVGAAMTQRPGLAAAVVCSVGVLDMLRYQHFTIGRAWIPEFGSAEQSEEEFRRLFAYSPLHNLRPGTAYPATLIVTGDHDDRVFPAHSYKFAAALEAAQGGPAPVVLALQRDAGHGAGKPLSKIVEEASLRYAFLARALGLEVSSLN